MKTQRITTDIAQAADAIRAGQLVAVPTETVYGLAGNGLDPKAVAQIYEVKGRPSVKPLSLMVHDASAMAHYCAPVPQAAYTLAEAFWPGPLTIVLRAKDCVPEIVRAGGETVGLRCPDHPATLALIEAAQLPLAAPSANPSGAPSPKTADDVLSYFDGRIAAVIDGGPCGIGRESTLVDLSCTPYRILRSAAVPDDAGWDALVRKMRIVGITGGTGCGKTTALTELERQGALVIDCDAVYHELLASNAAMLAEINARFPGTIENGALQRKKLGAVVFADAAALDDLNAITHRYVRAELRERARHGIVLIARHEHLRPFMRKRPYRNVERMRRVHRENDLLARRHGEELRGCAAAAKQKLVGLLRRGIPAAPGRAHRAHRLLDGPLHRSGLLKRRGGAVEIDHSATSCMPSSETKSTLTGSTPPARQACMARAVWRRGISSV